MPQVPWPDPLLEPGSDIVPLKPGDIIRYGYDPPGFEYIVEQTSLSGKVVRAWAVGIQFTDLDRRGGPYNTGSGDGYLLIARPPEGCEFARPIVPQTFRQGMTRVGMSELSVEAIDGLAAYVWGNGPGSGGPTPWRKIRERLREAREWFGGEFVAQYPQMGSDGRVSLGSMGLYWEPEVFSSAQNTRDAFRLAFANMARSWGWGVVCPACMVQQGVVRTLQAPGCSHFMCSGCSQVIETECASCFRLCGAARRCQSCCHHRVCECGCGREMISESTDHCLNCNMHVDCCECVLCNMPGCRRIALDDCPDGCGQCQGHCRCLRSRALPFMAAPLKHFESKRFYRGLKRKLGTEIEIAGRQSGGLREALKTTLNQWHATVCRDGSLPDAGVEIVTSPAGGDKWREMMGEIGAGLETLKAVVDTSCGNHVHVDATDLGAWDLRRVIQLYAHVEDSLFAALPRYRRDSRFCKPCGKDYLTWLEDGNKKLNKRWLAMKQYEIDPERELKLSRLPEGATPKEKNAVIANVVKDRARHKYDETRYRALNLHSFWHRGTIEFRHAHGTARGEQIMHWGIVCGSIVEFAAKHSDAEVLKLTGLSGHDALLACIVEPDTREWLLNRWTLMKQTLTPSMRGEI